MMINDDPKEILQYKYQQAFQPEVMLLTEKIFMAFKTKLNTFYFTLFTLSIILFSLLIYFNNFLTHLIGERIVNSYHFLSVIMYFQAFTIIYSLSSLMLNNTSPFRSKIIKYLDKPLFNEFKKKENTICDFFLRESTITNILTCMGYCQVRFGTSFTTVKNRISTISLEEELLKAVETKNVEEVINVCFQIKEEIEHILSKDSIPSIYVLKNKLINTNHSS